MTFTTANAKQRIKPFWWVDIEGLQDRYTGYCPDWAVEALPFAIYPCDNNLDDYSGGEYHGSSGKAVAYTAGKDCLAPITAVDAATGAVGLDGLGAATTPCPTTSYRILNCPTAVSDPMANGFSISFWMNLRETSWPASQYKAIAACYLYNTGGLFYCGFDASSNKLKFNANYAGGLVTCTSTTSFTSGSGGKWNHVVIQADNETRQARLWIDGKLESTSSTGTGSLINSTAGTILLFGGMQHTTVGQRGYCSCLWLDQVAIFHRQITEHEILAIYDDGDCLNWPWRPMKDWLVDVPQIGGLEADPLNGSCSIPSHSFGVMDVGEAVTALVSVSDTPHYQTRLTCDIDSTDTTIYIEDGSELPDNGAVYIDRETIYYSEITTSTQTPHTSCYYPTSSYPTADSGDSWTMTDAARTEADGFWVGGLLECIAGSNSGAGTREIASFSAGVFSFTSPFPAAWVGTDTYRLTMPRDKIRLTSNFSDDACNGYTVELLSGSYSGHKAFVVDTTSVGGTAVLSISPPLPGRDTGSPDVTLASSALAYCTRGAFGSQANAHTVLDRFGNLTSRVVSTKVPFYKTREVHLYEGRQEEAETECIDAVGYITACSLRDDGVTYQFDCAGLLNMLSQDICWGQSKGKVWGFPVWGGDIEAISYTGTESTEGIGGERNNLPGTTHNPKPNYALFDRIFLTSKDTFPDSGNVRVDDEVIHYFKVAYGYVPDKSYYGAIQGAQALIFTDDTIQRAYDQTFADTQFPAGLFLHCRGIFSEKVLSARNGFIFRDPMKSDRLPGEGAGDAAQANSGILVKALMEKHEPEADVVQALVCDDSIFSDFPRYDLITYSGLAHGTFSAGDTITGSVTGTTATVMKVTAYTSTTGELEIVRMDPDVNGFSEAELINCAPVHADIDTYTWGIRPRNNIVDVLLQILTSTGTAGANGAYDTLPDGMGLGIDVDLIDVDGMEAIRTKYLGELTVDFVVSEPTGAKEFIEEKLLTPAQAFLIETIDGEIGLAALGTRAEAVLQNAQSAVEAFDADVISSESLPGWNSGGDPVGKITIKHNKHPTKDEYYATSILIFGDVEDWYKSMTSEIELELPTYYEKTVGVSERKHNDPNMTPLLRRLAGVVWDRASVYPCPVISVKTGYSLIETNVGDIVTITHAALPNMRTSARGLSSEFYQVMGKTPDPRNGTIEWTLWQIGVWDKIYAPYGPSASVLTFSEGGGKSTLTFRPYIFCKPQAGTVPVDVSGFTAGDEITFVTSAYTPIASPVETATIESVTPATNTVVLDQLMTTNPSAGNIMVPATYDSCSTAQKAGMVFLADKKFTVGTAAATAFKYE